VEKDNLTVGKEVCSQKKAQMCERGAINSFSKDEEDGGILYSGGDFEDYYGQAWNPEKDDDEDRDEVRPSKPSAVDVKLKSKKANAEQQKIQLAVKSNWIENMANVYIEGANQLDLTGMKVNTD
jgi:hypothetical protein